MLQEMMALPLWPAAVRAAACGESITLRAMLVQAAFGDKARAGEATARNNDEIFLGASETCDLH